MLRCNPVLITNRIQQLAVKQLRAASKDLSGEERHEAMKEMANAVYDGIAEAIDEVEKDLTYNARKFLGFELWPESIMSLVTFVGTIAFGLA